MGYTETHYTEDGRRVTSVPEEVRCLNVSVNNVNALQFLINDCFQCLSSSRSTATITVTLKE